MVLVLLRLQLDNQLGGPDFDNQLGGPDFDNQLGGPDFDNLLSVLLPLPSLASGVAAASSSQACCGGQVRWQVRPRC